MPGIRALWVVKTMMTGKGGCPDRNLLHRIKRSLIINLPFGVLSSSLPLWREGVMWRRKVEPNTHFKLEQREPQRAITQGKDSLIAFQLWFILFYPIYKKISSHREKWVLASSRKHKFLMLRLVCNISLGCGVLLQYTYEQLFMESFSYTVVCRFGNRITFLCGRSKGTEIT